MFQLPHDRWFAQQFESITNVVIPRLLCQRTWFYPRPFNISHAKSRIGFRRLVSSALISIAACLSSLPTHAELFGLVPGRSANVDRQANSALELGGGAYSGQVQWATVRMNLKPAENLVMYSDLARLRLSNEVIDNSVHTGFNGYGFGAGLIFEVRDWLNSYDFAFNVSYHSSKISDSTQVSYQDRSVLADHERRQLNAQILFSPIDPILDNGLMWYGSVGYATTTTQTRLIASESLQQAYSRFELRQGISLGGGLVLPNRYATVYAGAHTVANELLFGAGIRFEF